MDKFTDANEIAYFLESMGCGALFAAAYDFLRARRREKKVKAFFVYIEDIACLAALGLLAYALAFRENVGIIRWYGILGLGLGALLLKLALGDRLMRFFEKVYRLFTRIMCFIAKILLFPVRLLSKLIRRPISVVVWHSREGSREIVDIWRTLKIRISNRLRS